MPGGQKHGASIAKNPEAEEGIERAKRKGVTFGRKRKLDREMVRVAAERYAKGETMAELAEVYGVSEPTIWRALTNPFDASAGL